jgi:hypothetical protein
VANESLCDELIPPMLAAGFTPQTLQLLAANPGLLKRTLARTLAAAPVQPELDVLTDSQRADCAVFACPLVTLDLEPTDWLEFIQERSATPGARACELTATADFGRHKVFAKRWQVPPTRLLLIETSNGTRAEVDIVRSAQALAPHASMRTTPRVIFEVVRHFWSVVNEINAAYILVADPSREAGSPLPILFNPPTGPLKLGFVNQIPKNFGYNGYLAFCH